MGCCWCRELERRLDLYKSIDNPKNFQKKKLVIYSIAVFNLIRLQNYTATKILTKMMKLINQIIKDTFLQ
jgi:hypothetical protein